MSFQTFDMQHKPMQFPSKLFARKKPRINSNDLSQIFYLSKKKKKLELKNRLKD